MVYSVKEIYYTLQGEGYHTGRPAVFCRFAGCNLWSGLEKDRAAAICKFCDTDFVGTDGPGGGKFKTPEDLAAAVQAKWPATALAGRGKPFVVCTGGEPLLQLNEPLIKSFHDVGFEIAIETNGTIKAPSGIDWICVSPKAEAELKQISGNELKLVYPQLENTPEQFKHLDFENFYLQPLDDDRQADHIKACIQFCKNNPLWSLSLQTHKVMDIP